ncbi:uncharacterized protein LOC112693548 isoform X1 [Sipha flava]|uniref:Uncharacterized protein LOC112693548 isoform X1 n=1 Tax=Sipha flava TaxID=143950 RepID=A0A8B8GN71_9HEMI|nr:uncharacterized protein LOC112693548 isoform X1 [Sipha flava]
MKLSYIYIITLTMFAMQVHNVAAESMWQKFIRCFAIPFTNFIFRTSIPNNVFALFVEEMTDTLPIFLKQMIEKTSLSEAEKERYKNHIDTVVQYFSDSCTTDRLFPGRKLPEIHTQRKNTLKFNELMQQYTESMKNQKQKIIYDLT